MNKRYRLAGRVNVVRRGAAREAARAAVCLLLLAGCRQEVASLRVERRAPLPPGVETVAVLRSGRIWLGMRDGAVIVDSMGAARGSLRVPGDAPRLLFIDARRALVQQGARSLTLLDLLVRDSVRARRLARRDEPVSADPRGRWVYTSHAWGSVVGLDTLLVARWGWPDVGGRATALAVGSLGDRIYLGVDAGRDTPPAVHVLEAFSGRPMGRWEAPRAPRGLAVSGADPARLYLWDGEAVVALGHSRTGLFPAWRASLDRLGMDTVLAVRPSPDGARLAVVGREGAVARLAVLSALSGRDTARWNGAPPDVAWDVRGRLLVPAGRELLWLR